MTLVPGTADESAEAAQTTDPSPGKRVLLSLTLCALFAVGATLRFLFLTRKPFWFDECFSVVTARLDWRNFLHLLWWREGNMSLYYLLLRAWLHFGGSEFHIRSLSVILAVAGLPAIYWLACVLFDRRTAIISVALLSVNAYHIRYAQEARSYSLFFLLAVLSSAYFCSYLRNPSRGNLYGYAFTSVLAVYAHFYALLLLGTQGLALWLAQRDSLAANPSAGENQQLDPPRSLRRAWIWIGIAVAPLIIFISKTGAGPIRWIHRPGLRDLGGYYESLAGNGGWALLALYAAACATAMAPLAGSLFSPAVFSPEARETASREIWRIRFLLLWLLFPVLLTALLSFARPVFLGRYFIFCLPALIVLAASGLARVKNPWQLGAALAIILLFSLQGTLAYYGHDFDVDRDGIGIASGYVLDHAQPGDAVLFHIAGTRAGYEFYRTLRGGGEPDTNASANSGPEIIYPRHAERLDYRDFIGKPAPEFLRALSSHYDRVWVVLMNNGGVDHPDPTTVMLSGVIAESFAVKQDVQFPQVEVRLYGKR
jgi:mannosyltransferase